MIVPSVKKPENIQWLTDNEETFLEYMANTHSPFDLAHTYLHYETFDDLYVEKMIATLQKRMARKLKEEEALKKRVAAAKKIKPSKDPEKIKEKKESILSDAVEKKNKKEEDDASFED